MTSGDGDNASSPAATRNRGGDRGRILDLWQGGASARAIAAELALGESKVRLIVRVARRQGDQRAMRHASGSPPSWSADRIALLTALWSAGCSASQIAHAIGDGVTRNAVIGKIHRL